MEGRKAFFKLMTGYFILDFCCVKENSQRLFVCDSYLFDLFSSLPLLEKC